MAKAKHHIVGYANLDISVYETLYEKTEAVYSYLKIYSILCEHKTSISLTLLPKENPPIKVTNIIVPGGTTLYVKSLLQEILTVLKTDVSILLNYSHESLNDIHITLKNCIEKCESAFKEFDLSNTLGFDNTFTYRVSYNTNWIERPRQTLEISLVHNSVIVEHFCLRRDFFGELSRMFQLEQQQFLTRIVNYIPNNMWVSENPEMEVAELLYALDLARLDYKKGGNIRAAFIQDFYNLFGLDSTGHSQRLQQIKRKTDRKSYLHELAHHIEKHITNPRVLPKK